MIDLQQLEVDGIAAANGDAAALDRVLADARPLVQARCRRFLPNEQDAEEATQEALLLLVRNIARFEQRSKFTTWMYRVTTNAAIDCYRTLKRRHSVLVDPPEQAASASTPSVIVGARIDVLDAAEQLDERIAEAVFMRDLCDLEYDEIAAEQGVPLGTVKRRIHDGRAQLRGILGTR